MAACPSGISLTDTAMCEILNTSVTQPLPADIRPAPTPVPVQSLPTTLQTAIADCDGYSACKYIGYDFFADQAQQAFDTSYVLDTYKTSTENAVVLVKKDATTASDGTTTYKQATIPTMFVQPAGYSLLDPPIGGPPISTPSARNEEECAAQCDLLSSCAGFNFSARSSGILSQCELFANTDTYEISDNKHAFEKRSITDVAAGSNPDGSFFGNQGHWCKNATACNTEVARIINNVPDIQKFSTNDLDACSFCPPRSFNRSGFTVTNELDVSVNTGNAGAAITELNYQVDPVYGDADHVDLTIGKYYTISQAVPQPASYAGALPYQEKCLFVPAIGTTDQFYIFTYTNVEHYSDDGYGNAVFGYAEAYLHFLGQTTGVQTTSWSAKKFSAITVPYVTNGFVFMDTESGKFLKVIYYSNDGRWVSSSKPGLVRSTLVDGSAMYSQDYNKCIFVMEPSNAGEFYSRAASVSYWQGSVIKFITKPDGSNFMLDESDPPGAAPVSDTQFNTLKTANNNAASRYLINSASYRVVSLSDFWTFVRSPL